MQVTQHRAVSIKPSLSLTTFIQMVEASLKGLTETQWKLVLLERQATLLMTYNNDKGFIRYIL